MRTDLIPAIFPPPVMRQLRELATLPDPCQADRFDDPRLIDVLPTIEVLVTGWGSPLVDAAAMSAMPKLRAVLHAAGSVKAHLMPEFWAHGLPVSSAADANAMPVAEYTISLILLSGKGILGLRESYRSDRGFVPGGVIPAVGNYGLRVGIVGASRIGRRVIELLRNFDLEIYLYDPYLTHADAAEMGAVLADLDTVMATCDIVSLHAPALPATDSLINAERLKLMPDGAVLVNTARGSLVDTEALTNELVGGRISAVLDVTEPEPLPPDSPLYELPNVFLTPHVAGSHGNELGRFGQTVVDELERLVDNRPLRHQVHYSELDRQA